MNAEKVTAVAPPTNLVELTILGFNEIKIGDRVSIIANTSPQLPLGESMWVNNRTDYNHMAKNVGKTVQFIKRRITTKAGVSKNVYDINYPDVPEESLSKAFDQATAFNEETTEEKPY